MSVAGLNFIKEVLTTLIKMRSERVAVLTDRCRVAMARNDILNECVESQLADFQSQKFSL